MRVVSVTQRSQSIVWGRRSDQAEPSLAGGTSLNAPIHNGGDTDEYRDYLVDQSPSPEALVIGHDESDKRY